MNIKPSFFFAVCLLFSIFSTRALAQHPVNNYEKEWKQVDEYLKKELPQSALLHVKVIYQSAKKDNQDAQAIKALTYMIVLQNPTTENSEAISMAPLEKEIASANEPAKSILNSLLAEIYWSYYQQHRWQLLDRTNTEGFKKDDVKTWTPDDFHKKITELFLQSIKNSTLLQQTRLDAYAPIIIKGNVRHLRPTLFDLLVHSALEYFQNDERYISKPAYAFEITDATAFDPAADFVQHKYPTKDSGSLQQKALLLYQQLISFHLHDVKPDALIDVDIERIAFVNEKGVQQNKEVLFLNALDHIAQQYGNLPAASQAWYLIAQQYNENALNYEPYGDTSHRYDKLKAKEICERIITQKDSSEGKLNCLNLLAEINRKDLKFTVEKVNLPGKPSRVLVQYKNFLQLHLRIIKVDEKLKIELAGYNETFWTRITNASPLTRWDQDLPDTKDMQEHSAEIKMDALPSGDYVLLVSTEKDFDSKNSLLGAKLFYVSNISYLNNGPGYFVLHRETGQPMANATVQTWKQKYDYKTSKYIREKSNSYKTDNRGFFKMDGKAQNSDNENYLLDINFNGERLFMTDEQSGYYYNYGDQSVTDNPSVFLFTDRSIYRPGQTLFFKGIAIHSNTYEKKNTIETNYVSFIYLRDANYQLVDSMKVKTNDYGSFSGKFQLPVSGLGGEFTLFMKDNIGSANFSVEEYKRPKFFVEYEKIKGSFKVNDTIRVTGAAKAYAGNNIDDALVKYRVVRQPRYIYDWLFWRWWQPPAKEMEIAHGEIKTGKDGKFVIDFMALPDLAIDKKFDPVFDYRIYADVTDINGETRSGETAISVSYKSLLLNVSVPGKLPVDSLKNIFISTTNVAGEFVPAKVSVQVYKLKGEDRLIRNRYWQRPDQFVMSKEEYIKWFPYDEYNDEIDYKTWAKEKKVFEKTDSSNGKSEFKIQNVKFEPGFYTIEITTKDREGQEVKDVKYVELYDEKSNRVDQPQYLWTDGSKPIEPGEKTTIRVGSSANDVFLVQEINKNANDDRVNGLEDYSSIKLNNEKKTFDFTATENDRGGYGASYFFVKNNRCYVYNDVIQVPWTNKDLKIEYATFRDKVLPGSEEKWKIKISGYKNEKIAGEMLASMYDASLDQFKPHGWYTPSIWPYYSDYSNWNGNSDFSTLESEQKQIEENERVYPEKQYDVLFGNFNRRSRVDAFKPSPTAIKSVNQDADELRVDGSVMKKDLTGSVSRIKAQDVALPTDSTKIIGKQPAIQDNSPVQIRKNFNETAFFFPDLYTDSTGAIEFSFTIPEALTKWKFQTLVHTKDLSFGSSTKEIVTQKQLMVQPNAPRFLREGDRMEFTAKVVNLTDSEFTGQAQLQLIDATTDQSIDGWFQNVFPNQYFTVGAGQSEVVKFPIQVPYLFNKALEWRIVARAGNFSDGEEDAMPVLTNKTLVTETLPLNMKGTGKKNFSFDKLLHAGESETLQNYALTVEYTSNPAWYAVQSLPYLVEYPYECAEQTWNRYYANSLASMIANATPRIKEIFEQWKTKDTSALLSNLQKNQELKSVLLEETPWVLEAKSEEQQKKNIALLFDMVKMSQELNGSLDKLKQMQSENGGFVWFTGGPDDRYITQYIVTGIGHLKKLKAFANGQGEKLKDILDIAIPYLDKKLKEDYDQILKQIKNQKRPPGQYVDGLEVDYLYMRSFFPEYPIAKNAQAAYTYFRKQSQANWTKQGRYMQGMIALALSRTGDVKTPEDILKSLKERAIVNEELGMYWKSENEGWFWYQAPIETQSLLIEVFQEIGKDTKTVNALKTWLLKNKQTTNWKTTKATAEACYALLLQGTSWLSAEPSVEIKLGTTSVSNNASTTEAGSGYFKKIIDGEKIIPDMGNISVSVSSTKVPVQADAPGWGAVYWQYFENLDKIIPATGGVTTPLKLSKKLFVEKNTDRGPVLTPVNEGDELHVGDKIKVRVELFVDRDMEYVHMKDMRASCLEPVNVLSEYKWQGGLGYYESTKDASTNFFFSYLNKGTYVFEYPLFVTHTGNFSNGITTIQCMYAPEFSSHSEGVRLSVVE